MSQVTTCSFFKLDNFSAKWWAFKQMQLGRLAMKKVDGLTFYKILGSGAKDGFSAKPNFGTYVLLCVWNSEIDAKKFFMENAFYNKYKSKSSENFTIYAKAAETRGLWDKRQPFEKSVSLENGHPILAITRAKIRMSKVISFKRKVGNISDDLQNYKGVLVSIGVGEWPVIEQATISIWKTKAEMMDFAYKKNGPHSKAIEFTRKYNWFSEECFARFVPYKLEGRWNGEDVGDMLSKLKLEQS
ncbi:DUF3291 domain-containing protein [Brumimicrobium mesophilum]|uniref:DUF3291 domain-containing protein n=1 Tax=Brumimicrobium mesophilum TaxID=392717 RepID=UPI00131DD513|nr:DUF3291 domain-containing protein [Brumimicrobium mesophilum]